MEDEDEMDEDVLHAEHAIEQEERRAKELGEVSICIYCMEAGLLVSTYSARPL